MDFTLSYARQFYSSKGNPLAVKGFTIFIFDGRTVKTSNYKPSVTVPLSDYYKLIDHKLSVLLAVPLLLLN